MAVQWHKTNFLGVRFREHSSRKHGVRFDRCFSIRFKVDGKDKEEVAGWASEGMTPEKAFKMLSAIRDNIRLGVEPRSIAAMRNMNEAQRKEEAKVQRRKEKEQLTFSEFWDTEYLPAAEATKTLRTMKTEKGLYANWIAPALGDIPLQQIDAGKVEALALHAQKAGKSEATVRYILAVVSQVWNKAELRGIVQGTSPVRHIKKPRKDNRRTRFLSPDEARELLDALAARSMDMHDTALLSLFCGLRAGEIHALLWDDVNLDGERLLIRDPKSKNNRHAIITKEVRAMLERRYSGQARTDFVFPAVHGEKRQWVSALFAKVVDELGLNNSGKFAENGQGEQVPIKMDDARQRVVFHTLRHTFASWLVQEGKPLYTVAELMGHTTLEMTRRYSHLAPDTLRAAAMSLEGKLEQRSGTVLPFRKARA